MKNRPSVARRHVVGGIAQSPQGHRAEAARSKTARRRHGHRTISAQPMLGSRTGSVRLPTGGCGDCTATPQRLRDFRTISAQPLYGFTPDCPPPPPPPPRARTRNRTMFVVVDNNLCEHIRRSP